MRYGARGLKFGTTQLDWPEGYFERPAPKQSAYVSFRVRAHEAAAASTERVTVSELVRDALLAILTQGIARRWVPSEGGRGECWLSPLVTPHRSTAASAAGERAAITLVGPYAEAEGAAW